MKVILCSEHRVKSCVKVVHSRGEHGQGALNGVQHDQVLEHHDDYNDWSTAVLSKALKTEEEVGTNVEIVFLVVCVLIFK